MSKDAGTVRFADAKNRFSNRVADYLRYRPRYPAGVLDLMHAQCPVSYTHLTLPTTPYV